MALFNTFLYGSGIYYAGSQTDKLQSLDFYRTDTDNLYVFHWLFSQAFYDPIIHGLDYQLQLDIDPAFSSPVTHETVTEPASIVASGYSESGVYATINIAAGETLSLNVDGDGVQTIIHSLHITGANIASDIQTKVRALIAINPVNQPAYDNFVCTFNGTLNQYTLTSGSIGIGSTVVVTGGTAAPQLYLGLAEGGYEVRGNSHILTQAARRVLIVENSAEVLFSDVSATTNTPGVNQYIVSLSTNQVTFNSANVPDTITIIYVPLASADIIQFQRGCVARGYTVPVYPRIDSERQVFYARIRIKTGMSYGPFSEVLTVRALEDVTKETADRLLQALPDRHVYPTDEAFRPLADRRSNISKIYWAYATEFDRVYVEKEHAIRDPRQSRTRDPRLFDIVGSRFGYPKPAAMEFVDYRVIVSNMKAAALNGGTYNAVKLVGRAFTGVDPTIIPFSQDLNFITASETISIENIVVSLVPAYTASLSEAVRNDPIIPGSLLSGAVATVVEAGLQIPFVPGPYTITLLQRPASIPSIPGYTFTNGIPAALEFSVDFATGILTFNAANAGSLVNISYLPNPDVAGGTIDIDVDGDGTQTITLDGPTPFESKTAIAANIQLKVRELVAVTPANQEAFDNFLVVYNAALDQFTLISGNQSPTSSSAVVVSGGSVAASLRLLLINGALQTTGLAYQTPPGPAAPGSFHSDIDTGDGSLLTFEGVAEAGNTHTAIYKKKSTVHSYTPHTTTELLAVPLVAPYTVALLTSSVNIPTIPGFTYTTGTPSVGQFTADFAAGILTFNAADAGAAISVSYVGTPPRPPILLGAIETGFGIKIILNNPAECEIDMDNVAFLLKQILPAHIKFILV